MLLPTASVNRAKRGVKVFVGFVFLLLVLMFLNEVKLITRIQKT